MKQILNLLKDTLLRRKKKTGDNDIKPIMKTNEATHIDKSFLPYSKDFTYKNGMDKH